MNTTERYNQQIYQLPAETILAGRYMIQSILGQGGFGITYSGMDLKLEMKVAIKEFYPSGMVSRVSSYSERVTVHDGQEQEFDWCRKRFLEEAKSLAMFADEPNAVSVRDYFEENGTVYIVMEFIEGETIANWLKDMGPVSFPEAWKLFRPVAVLLSHMHKKGLLHRDISPDNLMRVKTGTIKLLDFGAARHVEELQSGRTMSVILKPGYAPVEQYMTHADQSPATDVYAFCATIYRMITGNVPNASIERLSEDLLPKPSACGAQITRMQEAVLLHGMAVQQVERISSMEELIRAFDAVTEADTASPDRDEPEAKRKKEKKKQESKKEHKKESRKESKTGSGKAHAGILKKCLIGLLCILVLAGLGFGWTKLRENPYNVVGSSLSSVSDEVVTANTIKKIQRDRKTTILKFYRCTISESAMEKIGKMTRITDLSFSECTGFSTMDPIAGMSTLKRLDVSGSIANPTSFDGASMFTAAMPQITTLYLDYLDITGGSGFLNQFTGLQTLGLNTVGTLDDLNILNLPATVSIKNSKITADLGALAENPSIAFLRMDNCGLKEVPALTSQELNQLELQNNQLTSLSETVKNLNGSKLYILDVSDNQLTTLQDSLGNLNLGNLGTCYVSENQLTDLTGLESALKLETFGAEHNKIRDLSGLTNCTQLQDVYLDDNEIEDISILAKSGSHLANLSVSDNQISDLTPVQSMPVLLNLLADGNQIEDLTPIAGNKALQMLSFDRNKITDISAIAGLADLSVFSANGNAITDVEPLTGKPHISVIDLGNNQLTDVSALSSLTSDADYGAVMLENNKITAIPKLPANVKYYIVSAYGNPIEDFSSLSSLFIDTCMIPWEGKGKIEIGDSVMGMVDLDVVDCALDQRALLEEALDAQEMFYKVAYLSGAEADAVLNQKRAYVRSEENVRAGLTTSKWVNLLNS